MRLRHYPLNAARHGGEHRSCRACDSNPKGMRLDDCSFTDRMNARFPLKRLATDEGCIITLLNSVPLNLVGRMDELPGSVGVRLMFTDETTGEQLKTLDGFINAVRNGRKLRPEGSFTTGHYFRRTE